MAGNGSMAQKFIPDDMNGDKRIPTQWSRQPNHGLCPQQRSASGRPEGNLAAGGSGVAQELTGRMVERIGPVQRGERA
jgi:glutathione synthase/RimK-type ligase-like ATP-grasp enzyme